MIWFIIVCIMLILAIILFILICNGVIYEGGGFIVTFLVISLILTVILSICWYNASHSYLDNNKEMKEERDLLEFKIQNPDKFIVDDTIKEMMTFNTKYDNIVKYSKSPWTNLYFNIKTLEGVEKFDLEDYVYANISKE